MQTNITGGTDTSVRYSGGGVRCIPRQTRQRHRVRRAAQLLATMKRPNVRLNAIMFGVTKRLGRLCVIFVVVCSTVAMLCGCQAQSHVSSQLSGASPRFVYCEPYRTTEIEVYDLTKSNSTPLLWKAVGTQPLRAGTVVTYGRAPARFATVKGPLAVPSHKLSLEVDFIDPSTAKSQPYMSGDFDYSGYVAHKWLNWNGQLVADPCDG